MEPNNSSSQNTEYKAPGTKVYLVVWLSLIVLTVVTVLAASVELAALTIVVCLAIAAFKSTIVFLYFMHLRYEEKMLLRLLVPIVIATLAIFIGLTYSDVITR